MPHAPPKSKASGSKPPSPSSTSATKQWNAKTIRALVKRRFNKRACWMQIKIALAIRAGKDVVGVAATGAGKTLSFWIALARCICAPKGNVDIEDLFSARYEEEKV